MHELSTSYFFFSTLAGCVYADGDVPAISETAPAMGELYARHYTCLNKIYTFMSGIQDNHSANADVHELTYA